MLISRVISSDYLQSGVSKKVSLYKNLNTLTEKRIQIMIFDKLYFC